MALASQTQLGPWRIHVQKKPILGSQEREEYVERMDEQDINHTHTHFRLSTAIGLPSLPEMVFGFSELELLHVPTGILLSFNSKDALRHCVPSTPEMTPVQVSAATLWSMRRNPEGVKVLDVSYDWTFTTTYRGTATYTQPSTSTPVRIERDDSVCIDYDLLRRPDPIRFFEDLILFEDELGDNGISQLRVKIRVMPECFFVLQRFFLRVDDVLVRMCDTRLFYRLGTDYCVREFQVREASFDHLARTRADLSQPESVQGHLPVILSDVERIVIQPV